MLGNRTNNYFVVVYFGNQRSAWKKPRFKKAVAGKLELWAGIDVFYMDNVYCFWILHSTPFSPAVYYPEYFNERYKIKNTVLQET